MCKLEETDSKKVNNPAASSGVLDPRGTRQMPATQSLGSLLAGIKEGDSMSALAQYLEINRERAYSFASANTKYNTHGRPSVSKEDEWADESEWDDLFDLLKNTSETEKNDGDV